MSKSNLWSNEDLSLLKLWMEENPSVMVHWEKAHVDLLKLFPSRPPGGIYAKWRDLRDPETGAPFVGTAETKRQMINAAFPSQLPQPPVIPAAFSRTHLWHIIAKATDDAVESYVKERLEISTSLIMKENTDMKLLLQKLTKIREAITDFKL